MMNRRCITWVKIAMTYRAENTENTRFTWLNHKSVNNLFKNAHAFLIFFECSPFKQTMKNLSLRNSMINWCSSFFWWGISTLPLNYLIVCAFLYKNGLLVPCMVHFLMFPQNITLHKILEFYLISCCGSFEKQFD